VGNAHPTHKINKNLRSKVMGLLKSLKNNSTKIFSKILQSYLGFNPQAKQLILKPKTVNFLCQKAVGKIEQLVSLNPDITEGLIAKIKHQKVECTLHFTPESITFKEDCIEGKIRLLKQPDIQSDSWIYSLLITSWKIFLGGNIPQGVLPEKIKVEGDKIYYTFPRNEVKLLETLFKTIQPDSTLITNLTQGELIIESAIAVNWQDINLQDIISILQLKSRLKKVDYEEIENSQD
jgi:hypothetical protein